MVSTLNLEEKYNKVRKNFCFYLDIQDNGLARSLSRRLQDLGLQQEVFLTSRVTHVVSDGGCAGGAGVARGAGAGAGGVRARCDASRTRTGAMLERARPPLTHSPRHHQLTVQKAIILLDKLYDTFFAPPRRPHVKYFTKHFIKIEFLDKVCKPVFKEFDHWPEISLELEPKREKLEKEIESVAATVNQLKNLIDQSTQIIGQKMTRKSRPRMKDKEEKEPKGGYCEMCNADYVDAALHRRSPHHLAFVRDHSNFLALDALITAGADVSTFLDKAAPTPPPAAPTPPPSAPTAPPTLNGERRSLRNIAMCNGDLDKRRSKRSQSPDSTVNGDDPHTPNGIDEDKRPNTRCSKRSEEDRQYYKVVTSTKLRSSGGFAAKRKESPPPCNGTKPLVVKFRKVRRSELSVLSDEAEQFMFPKRASSTSSTSSDEDRETEREAVRAKTPPHPPPLERRRQARPLALKEESSEEDGWPDDKRRRKRKGPPPVKRGRRVPLKPPEDPEPPKPEPHEEAEEVEVSLNPVEVSPLREDPPGGAGGAGGVGVERCVRWEAGRLTYSPAVARLQFAFESVPRSEPWYHTFRRQDEHKPCTRNVPKYFALYSNSPKLPYEIGQLPPLKPNCCPLSDLVRRDERAGAGAAAGGAGPSRPYGTRGTKKMRKRTAQLQMEAHPRKSPREHASTLAILGSAGLLHPRRRAPDDAKSTASEDTRSETPSAARVESAVSEASERLQQFLAEVFDDAAEYEVSDGAMEGEPLAAASAAPPDVSELVSDGDRCELIRNEIREHVASAPPAPPASSPAPPARRRGKVKKNRTGWPNKKRPKKDSRTNSRESPKPEGGDSPERAGGDSPDASEDDPNLSEAENEKTLIELKQEEEARVKTEPAEAEGGEEAEGGGGGRARRERGGRKRTPRSSSDEDKEDRKKKRALAGLLLQPVVRVARVDPAAARRLRSAARPRPRPRPRARPRPPRLR